MKVILLRDIAKVGNKYDVKEISSGHVRNFLLPKGLVQIATDKALKAVEEKKKMSDTLRKTHEDLLIKNIESLKGETITMREKANEKGHLFAGIHKEEIVPEIKKQTRLDIDPEYIELSEPIKELGEHEITVSAHGKSVTFKLEVEKGE
ncbi:MAG: 50S ribosomal protein L9 [Patescibacteria group bacterium]|nr:50S ribosomal protein L9 [Patescibacteria group bacterium]